MSECKDRIDNGIIFHEDSCPSCLRKKVIALETELSHLRAELQTALDSEYLALKNNEKLRAENEECRNSIVGYQKAGSQLEKDRDAWKARAGVMEESLVWAHEFFVARDQMNAKIHCAPLRLSPITERVDNALAAYQAALEGKEGERK